MSEELRKKIDDKLRACEITLSGAFDEGSVAAIMVLVTASIYEGYQLAQDHFKKFTLLKSEPTVTSDGTTPIESNQDELWEELQNDRNCVDVINGQLNIEKAKKRYRITRVK